MKIIRFTAAWCGSCRQLDPALELAKRRGIEVEDIDVELFPETAERYGIAGLPTLLFERDGQIVNQTHGTSDGVQRAIREFGRVE